MAISVTTAADVPAGTGIELTVYEDQTGDGHADASATIDVEDGENSYLPTGVAGQGQEYWWTAELTNTTEHETPAIDWVEINPDPETEPIGTRTIMYDGEYVEVPVYPRGAPTPDIFRTTTDSGEEGSLNIVGPDESNWRVYYDGEVHGIAMEELPVGPEEPEPEPDPEEPVVCDDFSRWSLRFYIGMLASFKLCSIGNIKGLRGLVMGEPHRHREMFSPPGHGLPYYPQAGDTVEFELYTDGDTRCTLYLGGKDADHCYGVDISNDSIWMHVRRGGNYEELAYGEMEDCCHHGHWATHTIDWNYDAYRDEVTLSYTIERDDGEILLDLNGIDTDAHYRNGGIGFGFDPGNKLSIINHVRARRNTH